jgi:hypothetical protein
VNAYRTLTWNVLAETRRSHESGTLELKTSALRGFVLDYILADLCNLPEVQLRYISPDFKIAEVWAEDPQQHLGLHRWSPTSDKALAEQVLAKLADPTTAAVEPDMIERLRLIVQTKCGDTVFIPFPVPKIS